MPAFTIRKRQSEAMTSNVNVTSRPAAVNAVLILCRAHSRVQSFRTRARQSTAAHGNPAPVEVMPPRSRPEPLRGTTSSLPAGKNAPKKDSPKSPIGDDPPRRPPWKALFYFTTRSNLPLLFLGIFCSILSGTASPFQSYLTGKLFQGFTSYASGAWTLDHFMIEQKKYVFYLLAMAGGSWFFHSLEFVCWLAFGELQAKSMRDRLFHGLLEKDIEWYDMRKNGIGALLPRLQAQIRDLQLATSQPLGLVFSATAQCFLSLTEAFYYQWKITVVTLSTAPLMLLAFGVLSGVMQKSIGAQMNKLGEAQKYTSSAFSAIETVKCFNSQGIERSKYMAVIIEARQCFYRVARAAGIQYGLTVFFGSSMFVQGFYYGGRLVADGQADVARVVTAFLAAIGGFQGLQIIMPQVVILEKGRTAGGTLRAVMAEVQQRGSVKRKRLGLLAPSTCYGEIDVRGLSFAYPARPHQLALDNVTLTIPGGETTFLIGKSGSGKSTLNQLLMRFYNVQQGEITLDGAPLEALQVSWLRSNVTLVEQTSLLFNDTVFRNIALGRKDYENVSREEVQEAAQFALLQLMISDMPDGLDTIVGFKGGAMSGGQRQRMALARARLRDTPILILDESTSALDHISRALMMDAIRHWRKGKTTIIITHDITQILPDDYLYVLQQGKLVQDGYRKHLEKMKDTPFQDFLPEDQRATVSPFDARKKIFGDIPIWTRRSSIDTMSTDFRRSALPVDPLEAHLDAVEATVNKRQTFLPAVIEDAIPAMGPFGRFIPSMAVPAWNNRNLQTPTPPSPTDSSRLSRLFDNSLPDAVPPSPETKRNSRRFSAMLQTLVDRTGQFAAESRSAIAGERTRRPVTPLEMVELGNAPFAKLKDEEGTRTLVLHKKWTLLNIMGTVWPTVSAQARAIILMAFFGASVHAVATPLFSYILSKLLATYANPEGQSHMQLIYSLAILGIAAVDGFHTGLQRYLFGCASQMWVDGFRNRAVERVLDQPKAFFDLDENAVSILVDSLDRCAETMRDLLGTYTALGYTVVVMCTVALIWSLAQQWKMTLIAVCVGPYILAVSRVFAAVSGKWESAANSAAEAASAIFTETFTNIKTVCALTLEDHFVDKYTVSTNKALLIGMQRSFYTGFFFGLSESAASFSTAYVFYMGSYLVSQGTTTKDIIIVVVMLMFVLGNVGMILSSIPQVNTAAVAASCLLRLAYLPRDSHEHLGDTRIESVGNILFTNIRFAYPSRPDQIILHNLNLRLEPGTSTAIVGGSGSGKSTVANLILDIWSTAQTPSASSGELLLAGREMRLISTTSLRSLIVPVLQNPTIFAATVAENITYGLPLTSPFRDAEAIFDAARKAGIHNFIQSLPLGYDTLIGDGGVGLSGGQAQRINIARALVRRPDVLILDEATSALDVESAALVRQTIQGLVNDKSRAMTVVIITHAREMMEMAERIVVLDRGVVVEEGGFEELVVKGGGLTHLLSGGEWVDEDQKKSGMRVRVQPKLRGVDWRKERRERHALRRA